MTDKQARRLAPATTGLTRHTCLITVSSLSHCSGIKHGQHLTAAGDRFFKYNDEVVTEVPASEVLQDRTGDDANPALLCYVRRNKGLIDTLHREILEREAADAAQALQAEAESNEVSVPNQRNVGPEEGHGLLIDLEGTSGSGLKNAGADGDVTMTSQTQSLTDSQMLSQLERDQAEDLLS